MNRKMYVSLGGLLVATTLASQGAEVHTTEGRPNVLIILLDDAGYNDFGFMGSKDIRSPHIDHLCAQGIQLTNAYVSASVSGPSRAGILSGRYQQRFGYECNLGDTLGLDLNVQTIGDVFRQQGYATACIGKWHQGNAPEYHPNRRGFDYFYGFIAGGRHYFYEPDRDDKPGSVRNLQLNGVQQKFDGYLTDVLADGAINFLRQNDKPFMMYLAFNAVHTPLQATEADLARFPNHPRRLLAAMTWAVDRAIGKVVHYLETSGLMDNTLIFFLSDNGGAHDNQSCTYPLKGFKGNKYEGGIRVPFFVVWKNHLKEGIRFDGLTSSLDIFATAASAAGIQIDTLSQPLDGVNLLPYFTQERVGDPHEKLFWRKDQMAAVRIGDYKLIRVKGVGERLYDLSQDQQEVVDLCKQHKRQQKHLRKELEHWEEGLVKPLWTEGTDWDKVTLEVHRDLMNNRPIRFKNPWDMKKYLKQREK